MTRVTDCKAAWRQGTGEASHSTAEHSEDSTESRSPCHLEGAPAFPAPRECLGNEAEKQRHLKDGDTALVKSLNSESAEYSLKKSLPLMGNLIFSAINGNGDSRVKRNPFQKMKKAVFYL